MVVVAAAAGPDFTHVNIPGVLGNFKCYSITFLGDFDVVLIAN